MYKEKLPELLNTNTPVTIIYDCCGISYTLKWKDANINYIKNNNKHICRKCWLKNANPAKLDYVKKKTKKTCLEKYGTALPMNSEDNIEKRRKKFKDDEFKKAWVNKHKQTSLKKYGVEHPMMTKEVQATQKATMQERYGVDHPYQSDEIMKRMKANNLKKYGVENVAELPAVQIKMAQTTLERYGVEYYNQLPEMKDYLRENCKEWLADSWANPWAKGITRPEEWNQKQRETVSKLLQSGNWAGGFKSNCRGRYPSIKCKKQKPRFLSSLELQLHFYLDNCSEVEWYDYECLSIPYKKQDGTDHLYFPDFLVKYEEDDILHILETKTWKAKDSLDVLAKQSAGIDYADQNDMTYTILFDDDVKKLGIDFEKVKTMPGIELY